MKITAGEMSDICWASGYWVFLDIGFSSRTKSCGLLLHDSSYEDLLFSEAVSAVVNVTGKHALTNLLIEAPLSAAFDSAGNPKRRCVEREKSMTRYWYVGPGCVVMVAAFYLLRHLANAASPNEVKLFEGFVSYKGSRSEADHQKDVLLLREVVQSPEQYTGCIYQPEQLRADKEDRLVSAFEVGGLDFGKPPVIKRHR